MTRTPASACLMLADLGAEVIAITKPAGPPAYAGAEDDPMLAGRGGPGDVLARGKSELPLDLKSEAGRTALLDRLGETDVLISEMRPGKLEAMGLGWDSLRAHNPRLILCEITGYGRDGAAAGHDINYLALSGALSLIRDDDGRPIPPQNLVGDYAAGGSLAVTAILAALIERGRTQRGRRLTLSMTQGVRYLMSDIAAATLLSGHDEAAWRGTLSGGMPTYRCYETADGSWLAVGALEPKFIAILAAKLDWPELVELMARKPSWPAAEAGLCERFRAQDRSHWLALFGNSDACVTPVLTLADTAAQGLPDLADVIDDTP